ncbi:MAG TPA: serine/threonine-protein kinase [Ideonella sp.]|uniref:serine/threonine-protein kinase n=1 Tax=Ideonella sp. TaxID=1929293 RepID=UPI002CF671BD|nr:serine/threonine-protein kinase [Ideonella sp.]HSI47716.1 serine/threonine-protein kinase [Ideonella sp.]
MSTSSRSLPRASSTSAARTSSRTSSRTSARSGGPASTSSSSSQADITLAMPPRDLPEAIGKYPVLARLGTGATSEVFLAQDLFHKREVAIKRVRPGPQATALEQRFSARFFAAEAALVGRLNHPNVVRILDAVDDPVAPYLVMDYVPGLTLKHFCSPERLLSLEQVVEVGFKCAMALNYVYRQGVIHRDVKPANILVMVDGDDIIDLKVTDFGSALNMGADETQVHRVGSLAYMSPEQLDGAELDSRADMYSLAALLYHLIAGRPPFEAEHQGALLQQIWKAEAPSLMGCRDSVTEALDRVIRGALQKKPDDRPASWEAFAEGLSSLITHNEVPRGPLQRVLDSERFNLLRTLDFFTDFGDAELWEVVHRARWQRFPLGHHIGRAGQEGRRFHIIAQGEVEIRRNNQSVATLGAGTSVGEMAYLAPSPELRQRSADIVTTQACTTVSFTPESLDQLSPPTRHRFDRGFIRVLVRRLHAAHEALDHPRRIL